MKRIYMSKDGLHIEGTKEQIATLLNTCRSCLDSKDGKAQTAILVDGQIGGLLFGTTNIIVEIVDGYSKPTKLKS